ncbi:MAG: undecaprenyl-diphosphate phosphatase [Clostridia bacterium]|nr:undecaprenyl-diphosphate phosphatase [Clostridia bacterium]
MSVLEAIIYGIIQGIAEFLPISSSGHLALAQNFFGTDTEHGFAFNIALHLATLLSVCVVFRKDVLALIKGFFSLVKKLFTGRIKEGLESGERLFLMLCVATLPLIPVKLLGLDETVEAISSVSWIIGALLIFNGAMLFVSDRLKQTDLSAERGGYLRPLGVGVVQALIGIMPGISRSGSTITGGRIFGFSREEAVRFSFLMSIPAILGACVTELPDLFSEGMSIDMLLPILVGAAVAAIVGFFAIKLLQYISKNKGFAVFSVYCVIIGVAAIVADIALS